MLHVLLVALVVWMAAAWIATAPFAPISFPRVFNPLVEEATYVTALVLLRRGHFRRASLVYLAGTWIWATLVSAFFGGIRSPGTLLYVSMPASAAWLRGYTTAIWTAGGCLFSALVFTVLEMAHASSPFRKATPLGIWTVIVQAVLINAIPVGQIIGRLQEALKTLASELRERIRYEQEVQALSARLINAQEKERSRLAREIHDDLSQRLALAGFAVSNLKRSLPRDSVEAAVERTVQIQEKLGELVECTRRLAHDLHPTVLLDMGLDAALRSYCDEFAVASSHRITFHAVGSSHGIPPATALCVYRVAQEAVQNSIRHAHTDAVEVILTRLPEGASLVVSDRGVGLRPGVRGGLGLISMKERARLVNGTVDVSGELGGGVTVTLKVPIPARVV